MTNNSLKFFPEKAERNVLRRESVYGGSDGPHGRFVSLQALVQGGCPGMYEKTIVLRKKGHWYVLNSHTGDEKEIILALMEYAEQEKYDISANEVYSLMEQLGWKLEVYIPGLGAA